MKLRAYNIMHCNKILTRNYLWWYAQSCPWTSRPRTSSVSSQSRIIAHDYSFNKRSILTSTETFNKDKATLNHVLYIAYTLTNLGHFIISPRFPPWTADFVSASILSLMTCSGEKSYYYDVMIYLILYEMGHKQIMKTPLGSSS